MTQSQHFSILKAFQQQVQEHPEHDAIIYENIRLTYKQVDELSDNLAAYIETQVPPKSVIAIMLGRNEYMMIAPLAALKADCAYLPLDPSYPPERLEFMVKDAGACFLIADENLLPILGDTKLPVVKTADIGKLHPGKPKGTPEASDLFILLYTSGTTGTPKGCMLNHGNVGAFAKALMIVPRGTKLPSKVHEKY